MTEKNTEQMSFDDGKYTVILKNGQFLVLRHGEPWDRDISGDKLVSAMFSKAIELQNQRDALRAALRNCEQHLDPESGIFFDVLDLLEKTKD